MTQFMPDREASTLLHQALLDQDDPLAAAGVGDQAADKTFNTKFFNVDDIQLPSDRLDRDGQRQSRLSLQNFAYQGGG